MPLAAATSASAALCAVVGAVLLVSADASTSAVPSRDVVARRSVDGAPAARPVDYSVPVSPATVVRAFDPPAARYGQGHLGVDLRSSPGGDVHAAADGTVTFSGQVAGRRVVVVRHRDGISTEYEPVTASVAHGATVRRGEMIGHVRGTHRGCPGPCLHWGAWRTTPAGRAYLDPLSLLHRLGVVRLLPWSRN